MLAHLRRSFALAAICLVLFGLVYPLAGTGVAQLFFRHQADGSITPDGSTLIEQTWTSPKFFHGRPDGQAPYSLDNPAATGGTNFGPRSKVLLADTKQLIAYWHKMGVPDPTEDLVTTSGSGVDPDITPADAYVQIPMVSKATGISPARLRQLIDSQIHTAQLGFLGSDYIDVLELNEALAKLR
jgi:potassium-transporting ATPase KdpC subunit